MKKIFYFGLLAFILYEFLNNYFVMPSRVSQELNSVAISHTMYYYKIYFEIAILLIVIYPAIQIFKMGKILVPSIIILLSILIYVIFNFVFTAENRYRQPKNLIFEPIAANKVENNMMIIGMEFKGESKAYPVDYIRYHHQIVDSIGGKPIIVTYCFLCRTGRVYQPYINGEYSKFRLVGVNHYNAMFEDERTKSWWSQETGICVAGQLKGTRLAEVNSNNMILRKWLDLYPSTKIMQPDPARKRYRRGNSYTEINIENPAKPQLGGTWSAHTFVVGISKGPHAMAYEWNYLVENRIINDTIDNTAFSLVLSDDNSSFAAFENPGTRAGTLRNDTLFFNDIPYNFAGINLTSSEQELKSMNAYQEYWFSWLYAHPNTTKVNL